MTEQKERHGCVNAWSWLIVISYFATAGYYVYAIFNNTVNSLIWLNCAYAILSMGLVLGSILIFRWNKLGFYLFIACSILKALISATDESNALTSIDSTTATIVNTIFSLFAILIWWGILHIKKNAISAWRLMESGVDYKHCRHLYQFFIGIIVVIFGVTAFVASKNTAKVNQPIKEFVDTIPTRRDTIQATKLTIEQKLLNPSKAKEGLVELRQEVKKKNIKYMFILSQLYTTSYRTLVLDRAILTMQENLRGVVKQDPARAHAILVEIKRMDNTFYPALYELARDYFAGPKLTGGEPQNLKLAKELLIQAKQYATKANDRVYVDKISGMLNLY